MSASPNPSSATDQRSYSLKRRALLFLSTLFLLFFLVLAFLLQKSFERSLVSAMQNNLTLQVRLLLADIEVEDEQLLVLSVQEPALNKPESGLQAFVFVDGDRNPVWSSTSAASDDGEEIAETFYPLAASVVRGKPDFMRIHSGFALVFRAVFARDDASVLSADDVMAASTDDLSFSVPYTVVIHDKGVNFRQQLAVFQRTMIIGLSLALCVFMSLLYLMLRSLFSPLERVESQLQGVEMGDLDSFSEDYPQEINGLARRLNRFVTSERAQRERYKNTLADLAHSFKTPIAVVKASVSRAEQERDSITLEQMERMEQIVSHQLRRGQFSSQQLMGYRSDCVPIIRRLLSTLEKIYSAKAIEIRHILPDACWVTLPEDELFELLGNLLDNAFKYAESSVSVEIEAQLREANSSTSDRARLEIVNDGQRLSANEFSRVGERGRRLDEAVEGHGIGLAVAQSIAAAYGVEISAAEPAGAGAQISVLMPASYKS